MISLERLQLGKEKECCKLSTIERQLEKIDRSRFDRGREFFQKHMGSVMFSYLCALVVGFSVEQLSEALQFTGKSKGAENSKNRYLATAAHLYLWHTQDIFDQRSLAYRSICYVAKLHLATQTAMKNENDKRVFFSQYDMALVQSGFIGPIVMYPTHFGIKCTQSQLEDYVYFWRVIGSVLGIEDDYNICLNGVEETITICKLVEQQVIVPIIKEPPPLFTQLSTDFIAGLQSLMWISKSTVFAFTFPLMELPFTEKLTGWESLLLSILKVKFWLFYRVPWVRNSFNCLVGYLMSNFVKRYVK